MNGSNKKTMSPGVSVVVPVYQSTDTVVELCSRISNSLSAEDFEIILVDDGSRTETWQVIERIAGIDQRVKGIRLSRNFGQHSALLAGIRAARYKTTVTLDDDLQNPPEEIPRLIEELVSKDLDIVYGFPVQVMDSRVRKTGGRAIRLLMKTLLGIRNAQNTSSFRAFRTRLRDAFLGDLGPNISIDAVLSWASLNSGYVSVSHHQRNAGRSNYNLKKLMRFTSDTITGYGILPLQIATGIGFLTVVFGFCLLAFLVVQRIVVSESTPGFTLLASLITIFAGIQLIIMGVIGEYLGRMHYRIMRKPSFVIRETTEDSLE